MGLYDYFPEGFAPATGIVGVAAGVALFGIGVVSGLQVNDVYAYKVFLGGTHISTVLIMTGLSIAVVSPLWYWVLRPFIYWRQTNN
jgi:hypothetical protein